MPIISTYLTIAGALEDLTVAELKARSALLPDSRSWTRKADIIAEILPYFQTDRLQQLWSSLTAMQQAALSEVVHSEVSTLDFRRFEAKYGEPPGLDTHDGSWASKPTLLNLFFYANVLPNDLKALLQPFVPQPEPFEIAAIEEAPKFIVREYEHYDQKTRKTFVETEEEPLIARNTEAAAREELAAMLHLVASGKLRVSDKTLMPSAAAVKLVASNLTEADWYDESESAEDTEDSEDSIDQPPGPIKAFAWPLLLQAAELVNVRTGRLELSRTGNAALAARPAETLRSMWKKWLAYRGFDELKRINAIKGQGGSGKSSLTAPARRRAAIAAALAKCPVGLWISMDEFWRVVVMDHDFEITRNEWSLYVYDREYGSLGHSGNSWALLQGRYILCFLFEYAATLGLIDVAYIHPSGAMDDFGDQWGTDDLDFFSRYDGLEYIRINSLGAFCLGLAQSYTPAVVPVRKSLRVLPNHDVVVIEPPLSAADAILLDRFAKSTSAGVWRLDQQKLLSAMEEGHSLDPLLTLLRDKSVGEIPDTVARLLDETEQRGRKIRDCGVARLFECADPHVRTLILHDKRTSGLCYPAGDRHIVVPADMEKAFIRALRELGYVVAR